MKKVLIAIALIVGFMVLQLNAQDDIGQSLAFQFYQNEEYDKAAELFEKLYNKADDKEQYYKYYYNSLVQIGEYKKVEKVVEKALKQEPDRLTYYVDLGRIYEANNDSKGAQKAYKQAIEELTPNEVQTRQLAAAFLSLGSTDLTIATYEQAQRLFTDQYMFSLDLATLYTKANEPKKAVNSYLATIEGDPRRMQEVKNRLQDAIQQRFFSEALREELLTRVQQRNNGNIYSELLIWQFTQLKNYKMALVQTKALDKRMKENGFRVLDLGRTLQRQQEYDLAIDAFQYVIEKGRSPIYIQTRQELLYTKQLKIETALSYTQLDLDELNIALDDFINEFGTTAITAPTIQNKASLMAFYYDDLDSAAAILEELMNNSQLGRVFKAQLKLDLGDLYLLMGDIWEGSLLYSQVDKAFGDEPVAEMARFKNAKLSYYVGDFEWSQAQLDILKGSTSELISNDALELSVFITDNMGLDTTLYPMMMYARAQLLEFQKKYGDAINTMDSVINIYPGHGLADDILFSKAKIKIKEQKFQEALPFLEEVLKWHAEDLLGDDATYMLAQLYDKQLKDPEKAQQLYQDLIFNFKDSIYIVEARKRFRQLRGDQL